MEDFYTTNMTTKKLLNNYFLLTLKVLVLKGTTNTTNYLRGGNSSKSKTLI